MRCVAQAWLVAGTFGCIGVACALPRTGQLDVGSESIPFEDGGSVDAGAVVKPPHDAVGVSTDAASEQSLTPETGPIGHLPPDASVVTGCGASLNSDSKNCGACGHDCLGGSCEGAICQPFTIATGDVPKQIAIDATHVYWTNWGAAPGTGTVVRALKNGANVVTLAGAQQNPLGLALSATALYWTNWTGGAVHACPLTGCASLTTPPVLAGGTHPWAIAIDGSRVFWNANGDGNIWRTPTESGTSTTVAIALNGPVDVKVDATYAYFTSAGEVSRVRKDGAGLLESIARNQIASEYLALDAAHIYWTQNGTAPGYTDGVVMAADLDGANPTRISSSEHRPRGIAVEATGLYWTNYGSAAPAASDGSVMRCSFANKTASRICTPTRVASAQGNPIAIATDADAVYWINERGAVMKLAK